MKKMRHLFYIFLLTITSFFTMSMHKANPSSKNIGKPECWRDTIRCEIIEKYTEKYNLEVSAVFGDIIRGVMHDVGVIFRRYQITSKAKARQIIVECVQDFLEKINSCEELQPYLLDRPFTVKNIDILLAILNPDETEVAYPKICIANTRGNKIIYKTSNPEYPYNYIEEEESFENAVKLVKTAKSARPH
jgi:hypothetical protein